MLQFMQTRLDQVAVPTTIHCDHLIQARVEDATDLQESLSENQEVYDFLRSAAVRYGAGFWEPGAGIIHQVILENYAFPGALIIGTDSHTPNAGGLGAYSVGVGGADAVEVIAGQPWEVLYPRRIAVVLSGQLDGWTAPKDIILWVAGQLGVAGGTNAIVEYIVPGARTISATGKETIANMGAELGAKTSVFSYDDRMGRYLAATDRAAFVPIIERWTEMLAPDPEVEADPHAHYDKVLELDLSELQPHIVGPHSPDRARPLADMAAEIADDANGFNDIVSSALIGSCTNSSYEDMSRAADVARQASAHGVKTATSLMITPGSSCIRETIERDGQTGTLAAIGGTVLANACGPCIGQWRGDLASVPESNTILTSYNRNFSGRNDGSSGTMNFIASLEIVTAIALAGRLSFDPRRDTLVGADGIAFRLNPPALAPDVPEAGFDPGRAAYVAPPADGSGVKLKIAPDSKRLQVLEPWPAWDGNDFVDMPVLVKTIGKLTTDDISPAGPWLALRGHLDRFSDNMLSGAKNAFTGVKGVGANVVTGETGLNISAIARQYRAAGIRWVVVGDSNYGEGSSREHAALSPRLLGGATAIARSFARIHETNLKKQGLLALTFSSPEDYDRIRADERLNLVNLNDMAPGIPVTCLLRHADGTTEELPLAHSYTAAQLGWFRAGSALNAMYQKR